MKSVIVVGAGASGMMAAIFAAREGASVTVLEAMEKPGKKLLMTGNGRCNLTNLDIAKEDCYRGADADFYQSVLTQFSAMDTVAFFENMGLLLQERKGGIYPLTDQAASVAERLMLELKKLHVKVKCMEKIVRIEKKNEIWKVYTDSWCYEADSVILACGSRAVPSTGSDGSGYLLAEMAGHRIESPFPALVPLKCKESFVKKLAGLRTKAVVTLQITDPKDGRVTQYKESGELQWTEYGISGIVVFQLSRYASFALQEQKRVQVWVDCLPSVQEEALTGLLQKKMEEEVIGDALIGILPKKMIPVMLEGMQAKMSDCLSEDAIKQLCHRMKSLSLTVIGTKSFEQAQVCGGGVSTEEISPETMESKLQKGLYITGELMNVDAICGGYNLQWAWSTGAIAGKHSAGKGECDA